ncbi:MAG: nuclear transport factor 2 family protein [Anaerolineales bacterium]|nr:nuclear transport factor 2 family protein [Anaerolineales bacterium]
MADQNRRNLFPSVVVAVAILISPATSAVCGLGQSVNVEATVAAGIVATQQAAVNMQATIDAAVAATQIANQAGQSQAPVPTPLLTPLPFTPAPPNPPADPEQIRAVILNEVNATVAQDLVLLKSLYAPDAVIIDHNGTPDDPGDDTTWQGWANIERRYLAFFSVGPSSLTLVDLAIQVDGNRAMGTHRGVVIDGTLYRDQGIYTLAKLNGHWLITQLDYGNEKGAVPGQGTADTSANQPARDDGLYVLKIGNQHRYEEPWGWDRGDPCKAWETGDFDDTRPNYRGFNVELLLTNNSETKAPDAWPISFTTAKGKSVKACYYGYEGSGPPPGTTSSVTFFTVVEKGDYVEKITFSLDDQTVQLCLDGQGGWSRC